MTETRSRDSARSGVGRPRATPSARTALYRLATSQLAIAGVFVAVSIMLRGSFVGAVWSINPDEAELLAQARAAMRSPVPFTTWTTTTAGPVWVLFLALLGAVGMPLTIAFAHLLAAVFVGVLGYLGFRLASRHLPVGLSLVSTAFWYLPFVLVLTGGIGDYAPLATELLPAVLVLSAALVPVRALDTRPWLFLATGALCGLAVGAKYQVAPLALAVLAVHLGSLSNPSARPLVRAAAMSVAGAVVPAVILLSAMLVSPSVSMTALRQNINFLSAYSSVTFDQRVSNMIDLLTSDHLAVLYLLVLWLGIFSTPVVRLRRCTYLGAGALTVAAGGMPFGHYVIFMYAAVALAIALPVRMETEVIPVRTPRRATYVAALAALLGWQLSFGPSIGYANLAGPADIRPALSASGAPRDPELAELCPPGSTVLVWGWAPDLYVNYEWTNAIPFINVLQLTSTAKNYESGLDLVRAATEQSSTRCFIDAVGHPFFNMYGEPPSVFAHYPAIAASLDQYYQRIERVIDCVACAIFVRR